MGTKKLFTINNFDLLRLIAAFQVVFQHSISHLNIGQEVSSIWKINDYIPGVPIFFFISGYLISKSYESNLCIKEYSQNRVLRIFPALFVCVLLSTLSVYLIGYYGEINVPKGEFFLWLLGQLSFVQFYNPEFMRAYGTGVLNGSLWTISVELQFYILVPMLYWLLKSFRQIGANKIIVILFFIFLIFNRLYFSVNDGYKDVLLFKLFGVTFIPWFYMFLLGVLVQRNFEVFHRLLSNQFMLVFTVFLIYLWLMKNYFGIKTGNDISPLVFIPLAIVIFSAAYTRVGLSKLLLGRNDVSYGIYIYHMPVINGLLYLGYKGEAKYMFVTVVLTLLLSLLSWKIVEYPSLMLKKHPLNPLYKKNISQ